MMYTKLHPFCFSYIKAGPAAQVLPVLTVRAHKRQNSVSPCYWVTHFTQYQHWCIHCGIPPALQRGMTKIIAVKMKTREGWDGWGGGPIIQLRPAALTLTGAIQCDVTGE